MNDRDVDVLKNILKYGMQIHEANDQFQASKAAFESNSVYRNAVAMCVLQIGELTKKLSQEYKQQTATEIPWHQIQGLRNVVAHNYGKIDTEALWETITEDVPGLCAFCQRQIEEAMAENAKEEPNAET